MGGLRSTGGAKVDVPRRMGGLPLPGNFARAAKELCWCKGRGFSVPGGVHGGEYPCGGWGSPCGGGGGSPFRMGFTRAWEAGYPCRKRAGGRLPVRGALAPRPRRPPAQDPRGWEGARRGRDTRPGACGGMRGMSMSPAAPRCGSPVRIAAIAEIRGGGGEGGGEEERRRRREVGGRLPNCS